MTKEHAEYIQKLQHIVAARLQQVSEGTTIRSLYDPIVDALTNPGKLIRPLLTMLFCEASGGKPEQALPAAVSVEMLHTFTLIHDDIMDKADLRRGRPSVYAQCGADEAILIGDTLLAMALQELALSKSNPTILLRDYAKGLREVCEGQALDISFETRTDVSIEEYQNMIELKTARLLMMSCSLGVLAAGGSPQERDLARKCSKQAGLAFQLMDDVLDVTAGEEFGKKLGGDVIEGKKTWLVLTLAQRAHDGETQALLAEFFDNHGLPEERVPEMVAAFERYGVLEDAQTVVREHTHHALELLEEFPASSARDVIHDLILSLVEREH